MPGAGVRTHLGGGINGKVAMSLVIVEHPLAQHYLTHLRDETTKPALFRTLTHKLSLMLALEATRSLRTRHVSIRTPLEEMSAPILDEELVVVPILRAGLGMLDAIVDLFPDVTVGYFGLERDEHTAVANSYYRKLPSLTGRTVMLVDPMLATGGSAQRALGDIYVHHPARVILICIVAAPEGIQRLQTHFPQTSIYTAAVDRQLNARKYILPGLGDFGDRLYGTT
ncbi:MAG: uracil phosphoribosyltransferase [Chthonomonadales bacterium]